MRYVFFQRVSICFSERINWIINHRKNSSFSYQDYTDPNPKFTKNPNPKLDPIMNSLTLHFFHDLYSNYTQRALLPDSRTPRWDFEKPWIWFFIHHKLISSTISSSHPIYCILTHDCKEGVWWRWIGLFLKKRAFLGSIYTAFYLSFTTGFTLSSFCCRLPYLFVLL